MDPSFEQPADQQGNKWQPVASSLIQSLNALLADLAIPGAVSLTITDGADANAFAATPYRILINGFACRLPLPVPLSRNAKPQEVATSLAHAVYQNRELFIDRYLSDRICEELFADIGNVYEAPSREKFHQFLKALVNRGFSVERVCGEREYEEDLEEKTASGIDATSLKVFLKDVAPKTPGKSDDLQLSELLEVLRDRLLVELGIILPPVEIEKDDKLASDDFRLQLNDVRLSPSAGLTENQFLVNAPPSRLSALGVTSRPTVHTETGAECAIAEGEEALTKCKQAGFITWGPASFIAFNLAGEIRRSAGNFLTSDTLKYSLELLRTTHPELVDAAMDRFELATLTRIFRSLLDEQVPIRNLRRILEILLCINGATEIDHTSYKVFHDNPPALAPATKNKALADLDTVDYVNCVRMALKSYISNKYAGGAGTLVCYTLHPDLEHRIGNADEPPLNSSERENLIKAIFDKIGSRALIDSSPIILTTVLARSTLRQLIEKEFPRIAVLSFEERSPQVKIQLVSQISLA